MNDEHAQERTPEGIGPIQQPPDPELQAAPASSDAPARDRHARRLLAGSVAGALVVGALGGAGVTALVTGGDQTAEAAGGTTSAGGQAGTQGSGPAAGGASGNGMGSGSTSDGSGSALGSGTGTAQGSTAALEQTTATASEAKGVVVVDSLLDDGRAESAGTGIVLTADGEVLTNAHVVEGAQVIRVTDPATGTTYSATLVGESTEDDVAVLQLSDASGLATATLDTDDDLAVGDDVTAVGNSEGTGVLRAADGTVAALDRTITTASGYGETSETLSGLIAVDADVVSGDSGGALLDGDGEVTGMTTAATSGSLDVEGYAIDIDDALSVVHEILDGSSSTATTDASYVVLPDGSVLTVGRRYLG